MRNYQLVLVLKKSLSEASRKMNYLFEVKQDLAKDFEKKLIIQNEILRHLLLRQNIKTKDIK